MVYSIYMHFYWLAELRYSDSGHRVLFFSPFNYVNV